MKKNLDLKNSQENPNLNSVFRQKLIIYMDNLLRGLISFAVIGIGLFVILTGFLHVKIYWVLPIAFFCSILISPLLSKIHLGERLLCFYENWLNNLMKKWNK